jgi:RHO1 GDP-GTP exchange protein 1/2
MTLISVDGGRKLIYGTDNGIYLSDRWPKDKNAEPRKVLDATRVTQIDTLEEHQLLLVLANKALTSYPMGALEATDSQNPLARRPKKIQGHTDFFKAGIGLGRRLVCSVKTFALSTVIQVFEPMDDLATPKKKPTICKMFHGGQETLKLFKVCQLANCNSSIADLRGLPGILFARRHIFCSLPSLDAMCWLLPRI